MMHEFYEFFAGAGMARAGLGPDWHCQFANDIDHKKGEIYRKNWPENALVTRDVRLLDPRSVLGRADLSWGSFPCQDLSLAGGGAGLLGDRSGTFWPFWHLMKKLIEDGRGPKIIALENVCGTLTSHNGRDFSSICSALHDTGYLVGALIVDAELFLPHSRARLFVIGVQEQIAFPEELTSSVPTSPWHTTALQKAVSKLNYAVKRDWLWWNPPLPPKRKLKFSDLLEENPRDVRWHTAEETSQLLSMMSSLNQKKVADATRAGRRIVGGVYKRTRVDGEGARVQRAEIRFDDVAGCLRTPAGGSSRQSVMIVNGSNVRSRLISSRETARLMGLPESYQLPERYNEAYHLAGDGVVVPVVRHLAHNIFERVLDSNRETHKKAA